KVCGTTNLEDARLADASGANAVGFIFAPSPRQVNADEVRPISEQVRGIERIGLFVNEKLEKIEETIKRADLTGVQLHGDEPPEVVASLADRLHSRLPRARIIKTLRLTPQLKKELQSFADDGRVDAVLIDTFSPHARGGTGVAFDWQQARETVRDAAVPI